MFTIILTTILVSAFFILFFEPDWNSKNKRVLKRKVKVSTTDGFIEDTDDAFIIPRYPTQLIKKDQSGENIPIYGDTGTFVAYSTIPEDNWLHGFPHEKAK
jgi:hypothetical protein